MEDEESRGSKRQREPAGWDALEIERSHSARRQRTDNHHQHQHQPAPNTPLPQATTAGQPSHPHSHPHSHQQQQQGQQQQQRDQGVVWGEAGVAFRGLRERERVDRPQLVHRVRRALQPQAQDQPQPSHRPQPPRQRAQHEAAALHQAPPEPDLAFAIACAITACLACAAAALTWSVALRWWPFVGGSVRHTTQRALAQLQLWTGASDPFIGECSALRARLLHPIDCFPAAEEGAALLFVLATVVLQWVPAVGAGVWWVGACSARTAATAASRTVAAIAAKLRR